MNYHRPNLFKRKAKEMKNELKLMTKQEQDLINYTVKYHREFRSMLQFAVTPVWIIHPRDFYFLENYFHGKPLITRNEPALLGYPAALFNLWRGRPELFIRFDELPSYLKQRKYLKQKTQT